jgi:hypothetical protein
LPQPWATHPASARRKATRTRPFQKINFKNLSYFSAPKNNRKIPHIHHTLHHVFHHKNHPLHTTFSKTTLKNPSKNAKTWAHTTAHFFCKNPTPKPKKP